MRRSTVIAVIVWLVALGLALLFVLTWRAPGSGEDAASAVERIRRGEYPPGTRGPAGPNTWALESAPDVSPDSHGKPGEEAEDGGRAGPAEPRPQ